MNELEILAEKVRVQFKLNYDEKSIEYLDDLIERARSSYEFKNVNGVIEAFGAFLGQCIVINFGGTWGFDKESGRDCITFNETTKIFPIAKTTKQFNDGIADSIYSFYTSIPIIIEMGKTPNI